MRVLIAGASEIGERLLRTLTEQRGHAVAVVDLDEDHCEMLAADYDVFVVHGDATDPDILRKAQIDEADAVVACTSSDPINTVVAMLAHRQGVERVIVVVRTGAMRGALLEIGATDIIAPTLAAVAQIETALHGARGTYVAELLQGGLHTAEMIVGPAKDGTRLADHDLPKGTLAVAHVRGDHMQLATPDTELREGDVVVAFAETEKAARLAHPTLE